MSNSSLFCSNSKISRLLGPKGSAISLLPEGYISPRLGLVPVLFYSSRPGKKPCPSSSCAFSYQGLGLSSWEGQFDSWAPFLTHFQSQQMIEVFLGRLVRQLGSFSRLFKSLPIIEIRSCRIRRFPVKLLT